MSDQNPHHCLVGSWTGELPCAAKTMKPSSVWGWVVRRSGVLPWLCRCARLSSEADHPVMLGHRLRIQMGQRGSFQPGTITALKIVFATSLLFIHDENLD